MTDPVSQADAEAENASVLVVEAEREFADLYDAWLADTYEVRTFYTGEAALENLDESVDVVLLDRRMPSISGDKVEEEIRDRLGKPGANLKTPPTNHVSIVDLS